MPEWTHCGISMYILLSRSQDKVMKLLGMTNISGEIVTAEVIPKGCLVRESSQNSVNSGLGIYSNLPRITYSYLNKNQPFM